MDVSVLADDIIVESPYSKIEVKNPIQHIAIKKIIQPIMTVMLNLAFFN